MRPTQSMVKSLIYFKHFAISGLPQHNSNITTNILQDLQCFCNFWLAPTQQQCYNKCPAGFLSISGLNQHNSNVTINTLQNFQHFAISGLHQHNSNITINVLQDLLNNFEIEYQNLTKSNHSTSPKI